MVSADPKADVALIRTELAQLDGLPLRLDSPSVGTEVYAVGSPLNEQLETTISRDATGSGRQSRRLRSRGRRGGP